MPYIEIPNKKKVQKKFDYHRDVNATPLPKDILDTLRRNSLKYTKVYKEKNGGKKVG